MAWLKLPAGTRHLVEVCDVAMPVDDHAGAKAVDIPLILLRSLLPAEARDSGETGAVDSGQAVQVSRRAT